MDLAGLVPHRDLDVESSPARRVIGVTTAAVPQAKTSATLPERMPSTTSDRAIFSSRTSTPFVAAAMRRIALRVPPSRMTPVSSGVRITPSAITTNMFMPPSSSRYLPS